MKKNILYHPLVKGICLILCQTSLLGFAFAGLRCVFLDATGVMDKSPEFTPQTFYSGYDGEGKIFWPEPYEWMENIYIDEENSWYYNDALLSRVCSMMKMSPFAEYLASPVGSSEIPEVQEFLLSEVTGNVQEAADTESGTEDAESETGSTMSAVAPAASMPEIQNGGEGVYPEGIRSYLLDFLEWFPYENSNLRFCVLLDGTPFFGNCADMDSESLQNTLVYSAAIHNANGNTGHTLSLRLGLRSGLPLDDSYRVYYNQWKRDTMQWEAWMLAAGILAVSSLVFLCLTLVQSGMRYSTQCVHLNLIDRLPLEPVLAAKAVILCLAIACAMEMGWGYRYEMLLMFFGYQRGNIRDWLIPSVFAGLIVVVIVMGLWILVGAAKRLRAGGWWRNTLIYRILRLLVRVLRRLYAAFRAVIGNLPLLWRWLVGCAVFGLWTLVVIAAREGGIVVLWFITALALGLGGCWLMLQMDTVRVGAERIAAGDINHHINTAQMRGTPRQIADSLNHIGDAISVAVEDRMKSERFRTELITNVSHDLKTPLTSIINYTDLLSKEECENETMKEYIAVLQRQSGRLKKLTEDLLEASKASTGTLPVHLAPTDAAELLTQAVGEYEERMEAAQLHMLLSVCRTPLYILSDGKHLWRVFDNLLSNICKYSMRGTRVYLSAETVGNTVLISFRNISENPIAVSAEELTERFVRGDASRHTDGSGLGLAIASSLCKLQGGELELSVDGDLFKAVVRFPAAPIPADAAAGMETAE